MYLCIFSRASARINNYTSDYVWRKKEYLIILSQHVSHSNDGISDSEILNMVQDDHLRYKPPT